MKSILFASLITFTSIAMELPPVVHRAETQRETDFFSAVRRNDATAVKRLLAEGIDPNTRDTHCGIALFYAERRLLFGLTALMYAKAFGFHEITTLLLNAGANPYLTNNQGLTADEIAYAKQVESFKHVG